MYFQKIRHKIYLYFWSLVEAMFTRLLQFY